MEDGSDNLQEHYNKITNENIRLPTRINLKNKQSSGMSGGTLLSPQHAFGGHRQHEPCQRKPFDDVLADIQPGLLTSDRREDMQAVDDAGRTERRPTPTYPAVC